MKQMQAGMSKPLVSLQHSQFSSTSQHWFFSRKYMLSIGQGLGEDRRLIDCNILYIYILHLALHPERCTVRVVFEHWYCCWAFLTDQRCSLLTLCSCCAFRSRLLRQSWAIWLYHLHSPTVHEKTAVKTLWQSRKWAGALAASRRPLRNMNGSAPLQNKTTTAKFSDY